MTTTTASRRRKAFTPKMAFGYVVMLIGVAATLALPVVMILANNHAKALNAQLRAKDEEIHRLKGQPEVDTAQRQRVLARSDVPANNRLVTVKKVAADATSDAEPVDAQDAASADIAAKIAKLHEMVVGRPAKPPEQDATRANRIDLE